MAKNKKGARGAKAARLRAAAASTRPARHLETPQALSRSFADAHSSNGLSTPVQGLLGPSSRVTNAISTAHGFTLQDEARNTTHGTSDWDRAAKLRDRPVAFVSAGLIEPLPELHAEEDTAGQGKAGAVEAVARTGGNGDVGTGGILDSPGHHPPAKNGPDNAPADNESAASLRELDPLDASSIAPFFFDTAGDPALGTTSGRPVTVPEYDRGSPGAESDSSEDVVLFRGRESKGWQGAPPLGMTAIRREIAAVESSLDPPTIQRPVHQPRAALDDSPAQAWTAYERPADDGTQSSVRSNTDDEQDGEDAILADYIRNMDEDGIAGLLQQYQIVSRALEGSYNAVVLDNSSESASGSFQDEEDGDLRDDMGPSSRHSPASDDKALGDGMDDDREADRMDADIDDAQLAALFAKQEELGLDGDELLVFDESYATSTKPRARGKKASVRGYLDAPGKVQDRSASALADAFDNFDLSNWSASSLNKKPKGARGRPSFDVSDSELEEALHTAWQKDRLRKKEKKAQREELRAQGLLGKHANPDDPRVKYRGGLSLEALSMELRAFLLGSDEILRLPPMDASARKIVHEIANRFKIKSKSTGSGDQRRPVLHRTKYTAKFGETSFEAAFARIRRRHFPRPDERGRAPKRPAGAGGRINHAAVTYREGEVVGGSAPEIAESNRGRAMLEKMGWMSGMALGAMDNKGIKQPITHVVKRTKAGLG
ncbi:uncharacterized protein E0L32_002625 [Thyridium curvatum]|uniref:Protein SQS1 n=1 Tax=Thyridium curvatum TaxID=1093900 RepID=A0A507BFJ1_9PEZI|nr:uncharacterized protein E0L32_002625 [Thyridium curvatum]TPX18116.1 hypothetical protein E0L32_002625 [Thyridium curvatum]